MFFRFVCLRMASQNDSKETIESLTYRVKELEKLVSAMFKQPVPICTHPIVRSGVGGNGYCESCGWWCISAHTDETTNKFVPNRFVILPPYHDRNSVRPSKVPIPFGIDKKQLEEFIKSSNSNKPISAASSK